MLINLITPTMLLRFSSFLLLHLLTFSTFFLLTWWYMFMLLLQHLLFSVTDPQYRTKPAAVSDVSSLSLTTLLWHLSLFFVLLLLICLFSFLPNFSILSIYRLCGQRPWGSWKVWRVQNGTASGHSLFKVSKIFPTVSRYLFVITIFSLLIYCL